MPKFLLLNLVFILLCLPAAALADRGGVYFGGQLGASVIDTTEALGPNGPFNLTLSGGGAAGLVIGYDFADFNPRLAQGRVELEVTGRQNAVDTVEFANGTFDAEGDLIAQSGMLNFFYETRGFKPLLLYYGLGLGWAQVSLDKATVSGAELADDEDNAFAWQVGLGIGYPIGESVTLDAGYRYFRAGDLVFEDSRGRDLELDYKSHTIQIGVRYTF